MAKKNLTKPSRKVRLLLLVEIVPQDGVEPGFDEDMGGPCLIADQGREQWNTEYLTGEVAERLKGVFPKAQYPNQLWYVKSVKEATAP